MRERDSDIAGFLAVAPDSEMVRRVRAFDWSRTPLGPAELWPPELKTSALSILESGFPSAIVWGRELTTIYNDAFRPILRGKPEALGRSFRDTWQEVWDIIEPMVSRAFAGHATFTENFSLEVDRKGVLENSYFTFCYSPLRLATGEVAGMMDTVIETTETVHAQAERELVSRELGHRLKNTLALVKVIAGQTLKPAASEEAYEKFEQRLAGIGRAHELLISQSWTSASLMDVIHASLAPLKGQSQIRISGPDIKLGQRAVLPLSMVLHELASNALKFGALSVPHGRVVLRWAINGETFEMTWRERKGPPVQESARKGFGSLLIEMGLGPGSIVNKRFTAEGFEADFKAPLRLLDGAGEPQA